MQQTGTLKKRRRRNIAKVNGLSTYKYDENMDTFTGRNIFETTGSGKNRSSSYVRTSEDTRIRVSSSDTYGSESIYCSKRITRDPRFHLNFDIVEDIESNVGLPHSASLVYMHPTAMDRSCFLDKHTMQRLKQILWYGVSGGAFPWKWNVKSYRIDKWKPGKDKLWRVTWYLIFILSLFLTNYQVYAFWDVVSTGSKTNREIFMSLDVVEISIMGMDFSVNMIFYRDQIREYINTLLKFNHELVSKYAIDLSKYPDGGRLVINLSIFCNFFQPPILTMFFIAMPFVRWYLFSYIYPKPWYWLIPGVIQQYCFSVQLVVAHTLITWLVVAHTNTMNFWLREIHNQNDSDCTLDTIRGPKTSIEIFKSLYVLNQYFNDCVSPLLKVHLFCIIVTCEYIIIRSMNHLFWEEFPQILIYPAGFVGLVADGFVVLSMAAQLNDLSPRFIDSWSLTKHKIFRRILMSCPTLRIRVGRFYFITVGTTICFFKVLWEYVINAIITFP